MTKSRKAALDAVLFSTIAGLVVFATWCGVQNANRDQARIDACTCGAWPESSKSR